MTAVNALPRFRLRMGSMQIPLQIVMQNVPRSDALEARIRESAAKLEQFHPRRRGFQQRRVFGLREDAVVVLHVGRLAREKDVDVLLEAWSIAREALGSRVQFVLAGVRLGGARADPGYTVFLWRDPAGPAAGGPPPSSRPRIRNGPRHWVTRRSSPPAGIRSSRA